MNKKQKVFLEVLKTLEGLLKAKIQLKSSFEMYYDGSDSEYEQFQYDLQIIDYGIRKISECILKFCNMNDSMLEIALQKCVNLDVLKELVMLSNN